MLTKKDLQKIYHGQKKSLQEIARKFHCSINQIVYWMDKYRIRRRSISDAVYVKNNPKGDPFVFSKPRTLKEAQLFGIGLGLYWGEGTKANKASVRLGNTDPKLVKYFLRFLTKFFGVKKRDFRFSLQIFTDIDEKTALRYWMVSLKVNANQFTKTTVSPSQSTGTYKKKCRYGVATLYYHNKKFRDILLNKLNMLD